jgi:hypothetical protein
MSRIAALLTILAPLAFAAPAAGDPAEAPPKLVIEGDGQGHDHATLVSPKGAFWHNADQADSVSNIIFVNRCVGGCTITASSVNNAATGESNIPTQSGIAAGTKIMIPAFPYSDASWAFVLACAKEVYSPYNVVVTDVDPGPSVVHHEVIVSGTSALLGLPPSVLGIAPYDADHSAINNNITFAFAQSFADDQNVNRPYALADLCSTIAQESAHSWGLDHEFQCTDPMTYQNPCGGIKYFRNQDFQCGAYAQSDCNCLYCTGPNQNCVPTCQDAGPTQNSHQRLLGVFGAGSSTTPAPVVAITSPTNGSTVQSQFPVVVTSTSKRGTAAVKILLNGYKWVENDPSFDPGGGQNSPIYAPTYVINTPKDVPDGVIDIEAQACDDLGVCSSAKLTVTKGAPCTDASMCAAGQKCDAGKCYWDPPSAQLGDPCTYMQECVSGLCIGDGTNDFCSQTCFVGGIDQCPMGFTCTLNAQGTQAYCFADTGGGGGCCSAGDTGTTAILAQAGLAGLVIAIGFRRRRRA